MKERTNIVFVSGYLATLLLILGAFVVITHTKEKPCTIVGLVAARNEAFFIEPCLRAMAEYTDAIVVLDDVSTDNTVAIVKSLQQECRIVTIIEKKEWIRDERKDKQMLLDAGRAAGGTHFILLDADELFSAACMQDDWLKNTIRHLQPGQIIQFPMVNLWDGVLYYRDDALCNPRSWKWGSITGILCDDGICDYSKNPAWGPSGSMHISRAPANRTKGDYPDTIKITDINHCIMHFKTVNLEDIAIKKVWYMMLEYIRVNQENSDQKTPSERAQKINEFYQKEFASILCDPKDIALSPVPNIWTAYSWFNPSCFLQLNQTRLNDIQEWFAQYGTHFFSTLSIWNVPSIITLAADTPH